MGKLKAGVRPRPQTSISGPNCFFFRTQYILPNHSQSENSKLATVDRSRVGVQPRLDLDLKRGLAEVPSQHRLRWVCVFRAAGHTAHADTPGNERFRTRSNLKIIFIV